MVNKAMQTENCTKDKSDSTSLKVKFYYGKSSDSCKNIPVSRKVVPMQLGDDEATVRLVNSAASRVINLHSKELKELAYK